MKRADTARTAAWAALTLLTGLLLTLGGCAHPITDSPTALPAETVWKHFLAGANQTPPAFFLAASLQYADKDQHRRLTLEFWGNTAYPLRLDLWAGIGALVASWREDSRAFLAYVPQEETAYAQSDQDRSATGLGLPFTLRDLALLATANWQELIPAEYSAAEPVADGYAYSFADSPLIGVLMLAADGRPLGLTSPDGAWSAQFTPQEGNAPWRPEKISFTSSAGRRIILFIKELETRNAPFPAEDLNLDLPPDTRLAPLPGGENQPKNFL